MYLEMKKSYLAFLFFFALALHAGSNKITILGSCSGTEPMPNRHHTAWILDVNNKLYQFDAGESCAYTAVRKNIDLMNLHALFISHPHVDHVGGLPHLLWVRRKFTTRYKQQAAVSPLPVYAPIPRQIEAMCQFLAPQNPKKNAFRKSIDIRQVTGGKLFDDGNIIVEALQNRHCKPAADGTWLSYSYKITASGKKIVFSGDIRHVSELDPFLGDCDILLMESGHHLPWEVASTIRQHKNWNVRKLIFLHHGRAYLNDPEKTLADTAKAWGEKPLFVNDGEVIKL